MTKDEVARIEAELGRLLDRGDLERATTGAIRSYGPQILGYLCGLLRDEGLAQEVFSRFCEDLWNGIGAFRRDAPLRTWAYRVAWNAAGRVFRDPYYRRGQRLE